MEPTRDERDERDEAEYTDTTHGPTRMQPIMRRPGSGSAGRLPATLASDSERDAVLQRLRDAFAVRGSIR